MKNKYTGGKLILIIFVFCLVLFVIYYFVNPFFIINSARNISLDEFYNIKLIDKDNLYQLVIREKYIYYSYPDEKKNISIIDTYLFEEGFIQLENSEFSFTVLSDTEIFSNIHHIYLINFKGG